MAKKGRKRAVETETLIKLADRLFYEELNCSGKRLTAAELGRYCRSLGYKLGDNTITRNKDVAAHLDSLRKSASDYSCEDTRPIVFVPIDADAFICNNRGYEDLKRLIIKRDTYYKEIADSAVIYRNKALESEKKSHRLSKELETLKQREDEHTRIIRNLKEANASLEANIKACKAVIDKYIDPAIAVELMKMEGFLSPDTTTLVIKEDIDKSIVRANTRLKNPVLQDLIVTKSNEMKQK